MLVNWQPVLGKGTSQSLQQPEELQREHQKLNLYLGCIRSHRPSDAGKARRQKPYNSGWEALFFGCNSFILVAGKSWGSLILCAFSGNYTVAAVCSPSGHLC